MADKSTKRFLDNPVQYENTGFVKRTIFPSFWQITAIYLAATFLCFFIVYDSSIIGGEVNASIIVVVCILMLGFFAYVILQRIFDMLTANEFQNAVFAGSASTGCEFAIIVRDDLDVVYSNPGYYRFFQYHGRKKTSDINTILTSKEISKEVIQRIILAIQKNAVEHIYVDLTDLQGVSHPLILNIEPIKRPRGFTSIKAVAKKDLTVASLDEELSLSEKIFTSVAESLPLSFYITDKNDKFISVNNALLKNFSFYKEDFWKDRLTLDNLIFNVDKSELDFNTPFSKELTFLDKNNRMFNAVIEHHTLINRSGAISRKFGFIKEINNTGNSSSSLWQVETTSINNIWQGYAESLPIPQLLLDDSGKITHNNTAFRNLVKSVDLQKIGQNIEAILDSEIKDEVRSLFRETVTTGHSTKSINAKLTGTSNITVALYISPLHKLEDKQTFVCNLIDTTEQKNLEQRFVHSQKMQAIGQLAGGIAHDFNNLLTAMTGFCDLLLIRHPSGDPSFADIMQIKQNSNRAANLVRQLLAFSRKQTMQPEVINITDALADLSNLIRRLIGENIELRMNHGRGLWRVKADQGQFEQVIINLAVNARDSMDKGGSLIIQTSNVNIHNSKDIPDEFVPTADDEKIVPGNYVLIEVIDSGSGIPKEILGKIFEPFFSTKEVGHGTGLGLSTVYGIIKQTGGYIYVKTEGGVGTNFSIYLKQHDGPAPTSAIASDESDKGIGKDLTGAETILLVEDEDPVRIFSARALRNKGYSVLEADCGEAALDIVNRQGDSINLIITDVVMPGITGPSMIEQVMKRFPKIKVIFISGYAEDTFVKTYGSERKFNFLPKPFTLKQLAGRVKEVLEKPN